MCFALSFIWGLHFVSLCLSPHPSLIFSWGEGGSVQKLSFSKLEHHKHQCSIPGQAGIFSDSISMVYKFFNSLERSCSLSHLHPQFKVWFISFFFNQYVDSCYKLKINIWIQLLFYAKTMDVFKSLVKTHLFRKAYACYFFLEFYIFDSV